MSGKKNAEKPFRRAYIEITNACNLNCAFCPGTRRAPRVLSPEEFALLARAVKPHTDYVCLHLMGEPLLHPALGRILEICGEEGLRVNLTTNGTLLEDVKDILLSASALRKLSASLHSFEANGDGPPLEAYLSRVLPVVRLAREAGIICELRLWNGGGARRLNGRVCRAIERELGVPVGDPPDGVCDRKLAENLHLVTAPVFDWPDMSLPAGEGRVSCLGMRDHFGILADGTVVPCCLDSEGTVALGNAFERPLGEILDSPRARAIADGFSRRTATEELCRRCGYARRF